MSDRYIAGAVVAVDEPPFGTYAPKGLQKLVLAVARIYPFHRGAFRQPISNLIRLMGKDQTVDVVRGGASFRIRGAGNLIENGILVHPTYNEVEIDFLREGTPTGGAFIDLGSNIGLYTLPLAIKAGASGTVLAVDANPDIVPVLQFNVDASRLENVHVACVAVSDTETRARLEIRKNDLAIVEVAEDPDGEIQTRPLLDVVNEAGLDEVHTMKADIEGYEDRAILPYLDTCTELQKPNRIVIEHLTRDVWKTDCFPAFEKHGYKSVGQTRGNTLFQRD